jgi:hypothetical protein
MPEPPPSRRQGRRDQGRDRAEAKAAVHAHMESFLTARPGTTMPRIVFCFPESSHAERLHEEFGGEPFDPKDRGRGRDWFLWRKR